MSDLIDRQKAMDALNHELRCGAVINQCGLEMAYEVIEGLPSAEPSLQDWQKIVLRTLISERKTGKWIDINGDSGLYECNQCHDKVCCKGNFCPNCGARMEADNGHR